MNQFNVDSQVMLDVMMARLNALQGESIMKDAIIEQLTREIDREKATQLNDEIVEDAI